MAKIVSDNKTIRENSIRKLIETLLQIEVRSLSRIQKTILSEVLVNEKTFAELKQTTHLTRTRQQTILESAVDALCRQIEKTNENQRLHEETKRELEGLRQWKRILEANTEKEKAIDPSMKKLLSTLIYETNLSGRVKGICKYANIKTLRDLVKLDQVGFLRIRNSGKKSITEVDLFLQEHGLSWNMDV